MFEHDSEVPFFGLPEHAMKDPGRIDTARILAVSDVISESAELVAVLESSRNPDVEQHEYTFCNETLHGVQLPDRIADSLLTRELKQVTVVCNQSTDDPSTPTIKLHIEAGNLDDDEDAVSIIMPLSRDEPVSLGTFYDHALDKEQNIPIPSSELRQTIASMIIPIIDGDYQKFSQLDMHDEDIYYALNTLLRDKASSYLTDSAYYFGAEGERSGWLRYVATNGELIETEVHNIRKQNQGVTEDGDLIDSEVTVAAQISSEEGCLGVSFYQTEGTIGTVGKSTEFKPELSDLQILRELIQSEKNNIPNVSVVPFEERHSPQIE